MQLTMLMQITKRDAPSELRVVFHNTLSSLHTDILRRLRLGAKNRKYTGLWLEDKNRISHARLLLLASRKNLKQSRAEPRGYSCHLQISKHLLAMKKRKHFHANKKSSNLGTTLVLKWIAQLAHNVTISKDVPLVTHKKKRAMFLHSLFSLVHFPRVSADGTRLTISPFQHWPGALTLTGAIPFFKYENSKRNCSTARSPLSFVFVTWNLCKDRWFVATASADKQQLLTWLIDSTISFVRRGITSSVSFYSLVWRVISL